ncbi:MAG: diguanylate cyclase [Elusimicrobia bacterium]|nr:diguanylate cyclase [Elusimicrobiota bacterium]
MPRLAAPGSPLVYLSTQVLQAKEYLEAIVASTTDAICTTDMQGRLIYFSPGAERMLGRRAPDAVGAPAHAFYEGGRAEVRGVMRRLLAAGKLRSYETVLRGHGGRQVHVSMSIALLRDRTGRSIGTLAISKDISERVALERRLRELSITDSLTGLFNQRYFRERAEAELQRARRQAEALSVILLDLDRFKEINDRWGHLEGDRILRRTAEVLQRSIRKEVDSPFRYGGDEFILVLPGLGARRAQLVARRIADAAAALHAPISLSTGTASLRPGDTVESLVQRADQRMYRSKRQKKRVRLTVVLPPIAGHGRLTALRRPAYPA